MDGGDHSSSSSGQVTKRLNHRGSSEGVQTCGRFIQENQVRVCDQLHTNGGSLSFSTRHSLNKRATNLSVLALVKSEFSNDLINSVDLFLMSTLEFQFSCKFKKIGRAHV